MLDGLRSALMTDESVAQFRCDYTRHLAEQNRGATDRIARRTSVLRSLEQKRQGFARQSARATPTR